MTEQVIFDTDGTVEEFRCSFQRWLADSAGILEIAKPKCVRLLDTPVLESSAVGDGREYWFFGAMQLGVVHFYDKAWYTQAEVIADLLRLAFPGVRFVVPEKGNV